MSGGAIIRLARSAAEYFITHGQPYPLPTFLVPDLQRSAACFVSIIENPGQYVRGTYGRPTPRYANLAQEIIYNTTQALIGHQGRDVRRADIPSLSYVIALLGPLERISDPVHLNPHFFGLYLRSDQGKTALIMPRRIGIETGQDQIATAIRESGVDHRTEAISYYRFGVEYFE